MRDFVNKYRNLSIVNKKMNSQIPQKEQRDEFKTMQIFSKLKLSYLICFINLTISKNLDFLHVLDDKLVFDRITY